jgi:hypothetical protein
MERGELLQVSTAKFPRSIRERFFFRQQGFGSFGYS